jgi:ADP-ribose pyrophosphatase
MITAPEESSRQETDRTDESPEVLSEGKFLTLMRKGLWEYVERRAVKGTVAILAITDNQEMILVEQFRPPVDCRVIEIPAGLAGDTSSSEHETLAQAASRELLEETGYEAQRLEYLTEGPSSAGLSTEQIAFFRAHGLRKVADGGGDEAETIIVHHVPLDQLTSWLDSKRREGCLVDYKVFAALYFLS